MTERESPVTYGRAERKLFGVPPLAAIAAGGLLALVGAIAALLAGRPVTGLVLLAVALLALALYAQEARRRRDTAVEAAVAAGVDRARELSRFGFASAAAWTRAGTRLVRIRMETNRLLKQRQYAEQTGGDTAAIDARLHELAREAYEALGATRARVEEERLSVSSTQIIEPE